jgi:hypothetical protein
MAKRKKSSKEKDTKREQRRKRALQRLTSADDISEFLQFMHTATVGDEKLSANRAQALAALAAMGGDWRHVGSEAYSGLAREVSKLEPTFAISVASGLLTDPRFQTANARLEVFLNLVVAYARGRARLTALQLRRWLETDLCRLPVRRMEDPPEDVFVSNVIAIGGNYRIFEGTWESSDKNLQALLEAFLQSSLIGQLPGVAKEVLSLLRISDAIANRIGLARWDIDKRDVPTDRFLSKNIDLEEFAQRVVFTRADFAALQVDPKNLIPFTLIVEQAASIRGQSIGQTELDRRPLIFTEEKCILANPSAVSPAVRRYVLDQCAKSGLLGELQRNVRRRNAHVLFETALPRVDAPSAIADAAMTKLPDIAGSEGDWDEVVCAFDTNKYAIVIHLSDDLAEILKTGLSAAAASPERDGRLAEHVAGLARDISGISMGGLVVVIYSGIGRGIALGLPELPQGWHNVVISGPDFETLASSPDASLLRIWKLREQMSQLDAQNVEVHDSNGLLNTYAFWLAHDYRLVPLGFQFPRSRPGLIIPGIEFIRDVRVTERLAHDPHAAFLPDGSAVIVKRYARQVFFPAMEKRPIYVAEGYMLAGELAGVYENTHLRIWVRASRPEPGVAREMTFRIWEALLSWLDRLVPVLNKNEIVPNTTNATLTLQI